MAEHDKPTSKWGMAAKAAKEKEQKAAAELEEAKREHSIGGFYLLRAPERDAQSHVAKLLNIFLDSESRVRGAFIVNGDWTPDYDLGIFNLYAVGHPDAAKARGVPLELIVKRVPAPEGESEPV